MSVMKLINAENKLYKRLRKFYKDSDARIPEIDKMFEDVKKAKKQWNIDADYLARIVKDVEDGMEL